MSRQARPLFGLRIGRKRPGGSWREQGFDPIFDFRRFLRQSAFVEFACHAHPGLMQARELAALREEIEGAFE